MAVFTDLPNELLTIIFQLVRETNPAALPALPRLCRALHQSGNTILHEHIALYWKLNSHSSLTKFIQQDPNTTLVRSLRLHVQKGPLNAFTLGMKVATLHVAAICNMLATLSNLSTFSICLAGQTDHRCTLPGSTLCRILDALPPSVKDLELDTEGVDGVWDSPKMNYIAPDCHMCSSLSRLLPQLENLRLRVSTLCPELLSSLGDGTTSKLRMATLNLELSDDEHHAQRGAGLTCSCISPNASGARFMQDPRTRYKTIDPDTFLSPFLDLQKSGFFPHLQHFYILTRKENSVIRVRDAATRSVTTYPVQDANTISRMPRMPDESNDEATADNANAQTQREVNPFEYKNWYMIRDQDGADWYGSLEEIQAAIDVEGQWVESEDGWRVPSRSDQVPNIGTRSTHRLHTQELKSLAWMLEVANAVQLESEQRSLEQRGAARVNKELLREISVSVDRFPADAPPCARVTFLN